MNLKYIISDDMYAKCEKFAQDSVLTSADKYARRNQSNIEKIKKDIRNGKIGEYGTHSVLLEKLPDLSEPDISIFDKSQKSWDPDLKSPSGIIVAVKSQDIESAINYGDSWVFQYNNGANYDCDTGVFKEVDENHYVAFNSLNVPKRFGTIRAVVKIKWLHKNNLFKPMKVHQLRGNKVAVYLEDLEKFQEELFQLND